MIQRWSLRIISLLALLLPSFAAEPSLLDQGFRQMYNLEFDQAHASFQQWEQLHPEDPMGPVSDAAAYSFAEFDRLHILQSEFFTDDAGFLNRRKLSGDPAIKKKFEDALAKSQQLADRALVLAPGDENAMFAAILRCGLHADYLALIEKSYLASLKEVKTGRIMAEKLLAGNPKHYDTYLAIGLENYLLSLKPAPVRWFLQLGGAKIDKDAGLAKLRITAAKGRFLQPYARLLLAVAALRDKNRPLAKALLAGLSKEFPRNRLYTEELARLQ
jgi:hypothetical protein